MKEKIIMIGSPETIIGEKTLSESIKSLSSIAIQSQPIEPFIISDMKRKIIMIESPETANEKTLSESIKSLSNTVIQSQPIEPSPQKKAMAALAMWGVYPKLSPKKEIPLQKCGLRECNVLTTRDFCCAEHCKMAKEKHKT